MNQYKCVIFDLDGTLLDTLDDLKDSLNMSLSRYHFPVRTKEEVRSFIGNGIWKLIERAVPEGTDQMQAKAVYDYFCSYYKEHCQDNTFPYHGIEELLTALYRQGYRLAIVSNKADFAVKKLCGKFFGRWIQVAIGEKKGVSRKPAPDTMIQAMKELDMVAPDCVYVGDSEVDILTAKNAGLDCISVTWGFRDADFLTDHGAKRLVHAPDELLRLL